MFVNMVDLILLTSTHEGWPNIVKEGLACNIPFVSTDVSDLSEIAAIEPSCFVCEANKNILAESIVKSIKTRHDEKNLVKHIKEMEIEKVVDNLINVYKTVSS